MYQHMYMPAVVLLRTTRLCANQEDATPAGVTDMDLMLPSHVLQAGHVNCNIKLIEHEWELQYAQASDTLHDLQRLLLVRQQLYKSKEQYGTGQ